MRLDVGARVFFFCSQAMNSGECIDDWLDVVKSDWLTAEVFCGVLGEKEGIPFVSEIREGVEERTKVRERSGGEATFHVGDAVVVINHDFLPLIPLHNEIQ